MTQTSESKTTAPRKPTARGLALTLGVAAFAAGAWHLGRHAAVAAEGGASPAPAVAAAAAAAKSQDVARLERGRYLVTVTGCNDCHTPFKMTPTGPQPDTERMLSGHPEQMKLPPAPRPQGPWIWSGAATNTAFAGPWGVTYAANLTPDKNTGLGIWDEQMFIKTLRTGRHWGEGRPILPPMPWQAYAQMTDDDLKAVFAYLRSVPPVRNTVPDYQAPE